MARVERDVENANLPESDDADGADPAAAVATRQLTREPDRGSWTEQDPESEPAHPSRRSRRRREERGRVWWRPEGRARPEARPPLRERLVPPYYPEFFRGAGWILPIAVTLIGGFMRFWNLARPNKIIFDETYYAKDGWSMWVYGWEHNWQTSSVADQALAVCGGPGCQGTAKFAAGPEYVVHPPIGKWIIGFGEKIWGFNPVGWRIMEALLGTLAILILARTARRMFRSTLIGVIAGLFLGFDGLAFVMARTALLDGIQMFFVLAAFSCLVVDRDKVREKAADWAEEHRTGSPLPKGEHGPKFGLRPWRILAGFMLGCATATKWNAIFFVAALAILTVLWDRGTRRAIGLRNPSVATLRRDVGWAVLTLPVQMIVVFIASYAGWIFNTANGGGYNRFWALKNPAAGFPDLPFSRQLTQWLVPGWLRSLWNYVHSEYQFNANLQSPHPYQSNPWSWLVMGRPVAFDYNSPKVGTAGCTAAMRTCSQEVLALGNPFLWWLATASIVYLLWLWIGRRDWRAGAILCGIAAGILPWMHYAERTIFSFYAVIFVPFMCLAAATSVGAIIGRADAPPVRRAWGAAVGGAMVVAIIGIFIYFYPIYTDQTISYNDWSSHMWFQSWI
jgi:dolichyl-phosphate-mannose--protein O-mannosyl transferase